MDRMCMSIQKYGRQHFTTVTSSYCSLYCLQYSYFGLCNVWQQHRGRHRVQCGLRSTRFCDLKTAGNQQSIWDQWSPVWQQGDTVQRRCTEAPTRTMTLGTTGHSRRIQDRGEAANQLLESANQQRPKMACRHRIFSHLNRWCLVFYFSVFEYF